MANTYGCIRVLSQDQNEDRQFIAMKENRINAVKAHMESF